MLTEYQECLTFVEWLQYKKIKFTHIANESGLPARVAMIVSAKKKKLGVSRGVPDYMLILPNMLLFIEMKRKKNSRTYQEQKDWIAALNTIDNVEAIICKGCDEAIKEVEKRLQI